MSKVKVNFYENSKVSKENIALKQTKGKFYS